MDGVLDQADQAGEVCLAELESFLGWTDQAGEVGTLSWNGILS